MFMYIQHLIILIKQHNTFACRRKDKERRKDRYKDKERETNRWIDYCKRHLIHMKRLPAIQSFADIRSFVLIHVPFISCFFLLQQKTCQLQIWFILVVRSSLGNEKYTELDQGSLQQSPSSNYRERSFR